MDTGVHSLFLQMHQPVPAAAVSTPFSVLLFIVCDLRRLLSLLLWHYERTAASHAGNYTTGGG